MDKYKHCPSCDNVYPIDSGFHKQKARYDGVQGICRKCHKQMRQPYTTKARREAIVILLGAECKNCGYNADIRGLVIDHLESDGGLERSKSNLHQYYKSIRENLHTGKYQILCGTCNIIKKHTHFEFGKPEPSMPEPITGIMRDFVIANKRKRGGRY